jgi:hypothetical protein
MSLREAVGRCAHPRADALPLARKRSSFARRTMRHRRSGYERGARSRKSRTMAAASGERWLPRMRFRPIPAWVAAAMSGGFRQIESARYRDPERHPDGGLPVKLPFGPDLGPRGSASSPACHGVDEPAAKGNQDQRWQNQSGHRKVLANLAPARRREARSECSRKASMELPNRAPSPDNRVVIRLLSDKSVRIHLHHGGGG